MISNMEHFAMTDNKPATQIPANTPISIVLIEDHAVYRESVCQALESIDHYCCTGKFSNLEDALEAANKGLDAHIILLDLGLPGMSGLDGIVLLRELLPDTRIIVLTAFTDREKVFDALKSGAHGYLIKSATATHLINALDEVTSGGTPLDPQIAGMVLNTFRQLRPISDEENLSERECEILLLVADGMTKQQIADKLDISSHTVSAHLRRVFDKLHVHSLPAAVSTAIRRGLLDFSP